MRSDWRRRIRRSPIRSGLCDRECSRSDAFGAGQTCAGSLPLVGTYTIAGRYPGGACPFPFDESEDAGRETPGAASGSAGEPADGGRATTLRRDPNLDPAAPATAPAAAAVGAPPNMNGNPSPPPCSASGAGSGVPAGNSIGGGGAAEYSQFGGTDKLPSAGASPKPAATPESASVEPAPPSAPPVQSGTPPPPVGPPAPSAAPAPPSAPPALTSGCGVGVIALVSAFAIGVCKASTAKKPPRNAGR